MCPDPRAPQPTDETVRVSAPAARPPPLSEPAKLPQRARALVLWSPLTLRIPRGTCPGTSVHPRHYTLLGPGSRYKDGSHTLHTLAHAHLHFVPSHLTSSESPRVLILGIIHPN